MVWAFRQVVAIQQYVETLYVSRWGYALIERQLSLPKARANAPHRRAKAHVPEDVAFATKPAMACEMIARLLDEGTPCAYALADAVHGPDHLFRRMLEDRGQPYVLAVRSNHTLRFVEEWTLVQSGPATMMCELPPEVWQPLSAGEGAKGQRLCDRDLDPARISGRRRIFPPAAGAAQPA